MPSKDYKFRFYVKPGSEADEVLNSLDKETALQTLVTHWAPDALKGKASREQIQSIARRSILQLRNQIAKIATEADLPPTEIYLALGIPSLPLSVAMTSPGLLSAGSEAAVEVEEELDDITPIDTSGFGRDIF